ncbi:hypothetical protein MAM1_0733d11165, partial [Mucor ambiguus]
MSAPAQDPAVEDITQKTKEVYLDDAGKPITKNAYKKLQKDKEKAERKAATAAKIAAEKAEREANQV